MTDEDIAQINNLGYFPGSFDPLHDGHIEVIKVILQKKLCDAVFVYCVHGKSSWKQRSDFYKRTEYCESNLASFDNVIISYLSVWEIQRRLTLKKRNSNHVISKKAHITGIIGADIACNLEYRNGNPLIEQKRLERQKDFMKGIFIDQVFEDSIACSIALPADDFIVALRENYKDIDIPDIVCGRPVHMIIDSGIYRGVSSSKIKNVHM
ncbi:MAG: hypothetical protein IJ730_06130 [Alphaproteobacteria bacterium]|nr:hypothetical protein [Alphaproteobacteria bacterium]